MQFVSEVAKSIAWLIDNDPDGWVHGRCAIAHPGSRVGVWTANGVFFCKPFEKVPVEDAKTYGHVLSGHEVNVGLLDKLVIWRAYKRMSKPNNFNKAGIPKAISEYAERRFNEHAQ